ncbi:MAG: nucleotidyltransferase family protein [Elusimicrobiota bacterium]
MKAMILAAGEGRRLRPLTNQTPKALIKIIGVPMIEIVIRRLIKAGVTEIIINTFHLADKIQNFLSAKRNFGINIEISRETELLDTGGGLKKAAGFFNDGRPFFLHNVDVVSNLNLGRLYRAHQKRPALATLAVQQRASLRRLLFDANNRLCGWESRAQKRRIWTKGPVENAQDLAFAGIHVISPKIFSKIEENGVFSINQTYLRLGGQGENIQAFDASDCYWADIGTEKKLKAVRRQFKGQTLGSVLGI